MISPEPWQAPRVSKHHFAIHLAASNDVFFLNPPARRWRLESSWPEKVRVIQYPRFIPGIRFFPRPVQHYLFHRTMQKIQRLAQCAFDVIWSFDNSVFFDFSFLNPRILAISHLMDYSQDFQFESATRTASFCLTVSNPVLNKMRRINSNSFLVPHGLAEPADMISTRSLPGQNKIKAVYAGNLNSVYLNYALLARLCKQFSDIDFVLIGPCRHPFVNQPNVHWVGTLDTEQMHQYFRSADVLLIAYRFTDFPEQLTNAHKILEYLLSGRVIVSNYFPDYHDRGDLLRMAGTDDEFVATFEDVIGRLEYWNSPMRQSERTRFARANSYAHRLAEVDEIAYRIVSRLNEHSAC